MRARSNRQIIEPLQKALLIEEERLLAPDLEAVVRRNIGWKFHAQASRMGRADNRSRHRLQQGEHLADLEAVPFKGGRVDRPRGAESPLMPAALNYWPNWLRHNGISKT